MELNSALLLMASLGLGGKFQDSALDTQLVTVPYVSGQEAGGHTTPTSHSPNSVPLIPEIVLTPMLPVAPLVPATADALSDQTKVTVHFHDAKPAEILAWLESQGVSFIVSSSDVPSGTTLTLNLQDQPISSVLKVIATSLGGRWDVENGIRVFRKGRDSFTLFSNPGHPGEFSEEFKFEPGSSAPHAFLFGDKGQGAWKPGDSLEKSFGPEFQKHIENFAKSLSKQFGPEFQKKLKDRGENWDGAKSKEFAEQLEKDFGPKFQMQMEDFAKQMPQTFGPKSRVFSYQFTPKGFEKGRRLELKLEGADKQSLKVSSGDIARLLKSLTPDQRDKQSKQGYLFFEDLTKEQREMFGTRPEGKFEVRYKVNGDELVVRGN
jgi:hypothetical protein